MCWFSSIMIVIATFQLCIGHQSSLSCNNIFAESDSQLVLFYLQAKTYLEKAIQSDPSFLHAVSTLAEVLLQQQKYKKVIQLWVGLSLTKTRLILAWSRCVHILPEASYRVLLHVNIVRDFRLGWFALSFCSLAVWCPAD